MGVVFSAGLCVSARNRSFSPTSEHIFKRELHNPRIPEYGDSAERRRGAYAGVWIGRLHMVQKIESFRPELNGVPFFDANLSSQSRVDIEYPRSKDIVGTHPEGAERRLRKCRRGDPLGERSLRGIRITHCRGALAADAVQALV